MNDEKLKLYDNINTLATRWLIWNASERNQPIGIKKFNWKNKTDLWLLNLMRSYGVFNGYVVYFLDCPFLIYFYMRYIYKDRYIRWAKREKNVFLIEPELFAKEVCSNFGVNGSITEEIYDEYWRK